MGTGPVIISDDGSPPPFMVTVDKPLTVTDKILRVSRRTELMQELTSANGIHPVENSTKILEVKITPVDDQSTPHVGKKVEVVGNEDTLITVKMESGMVKVIASNLKEDFVGAWCRYAAPDINIEIVKVDDKIVFTGIGKSVHIEVAIS